MVIATQARTNVARVVAKLGQILADAEAATGAGDHDRANVVGARFLERRSERLVRCGVERVQHVRTVERDGENRPLARCFHFGHAREPK